MKYKNGFRTGPVIFTALLICTLTVDCFGRHLNSRSYIQTLPREVRGYKVENAEVKIKRVRDNVDGKELKNTGALIQFDSASIAHVSPLGATLDVSATVSPVEQHGDVDLLVFEDIRINGTPVTVDDYNYPFKLPEKMPLSLARPFKVYVSSPNALLETLGNMINHQNELPVTGRVYVCGRFKKMLMTFKRAIPITLNATISNPF